MNKAKIAYLVVCWNNADIIEECLLAIKNQTLPGGVAYVLDNNSADDTAKYVEEEFPKVKLMRSSKNYGFSKGNNILIREVLKDSEITHIALINSDAMLNPAWSKELIEHLRGKSHVASAQGTTLDYYNHNITDAQHVFLRDDFQAVQYGYAEQYQPGYAYPRRVFGVNAAAALFTREFIEAQPNNKLFDERFYMYLEDVDVAFRATMAGWNSYYIPEAEAYHMGSVSSKKRSNSYNLYMTYRNQTAMLVKNAPLKTILKFTPNLVRNEVRYIRYLKHWGLKDDLRAVVRGRLVGVLRAPLFLGSRLRLLVSREMSPDRLERVIKSQGIF